MRTIAILLCLLPGAVALGAKEKPGDNTPEGDAGLPGVEFHHIARTWQKIDLAGEKMLLFAPVMSGVAFTTGHSFLVHERPVARIIHFGFDAAWFNIEYDRWRKKSTDTKNGCTNSTWA